MKIQLERHARSYALINQRSLDSLISAQFLLDLYDQYQPSVSPYRYRNVLCVHLPDGHTTSYTPDEDREYVAERLALEMASARWPERRTAFELVCAKKEPLLRAAICAFDRLELAKLSRYELDDWLMNLYYTTLNEVFVLNLAPVELGIQRYLTRLAEAHQVPASAIADWLHAHGTSYGETAAVREQRELASLVAAQRATGKLDRTRLRAAVTASRELSVGYGSPPRSARSVLTEYRRLLALPDETLGALLAPSSPPKRPEPQLPEAMTVALDLAARLGSLRDRNKALLGWAVRRRQRLLAEVARRTDTPPSDLRWYTLEEASLLLRHGRRPRELEQRRQGVVLRSGMELETGVSTANTMARLRARASSDLRGVVASPGWASGAARIVASAADCEAFQTGEILLARGTDFHLLDAMRRAAGIVTEEGGLLSHASVISRELGLPCLIGVTGLLSRVRDGDWVQLDSERGELRCARPTGAPLRASDRDGESRDAGTVGNKAWALGVARQAGVKVAPFEVLSEPFFERWLKLAGLSLEQLGRLDAPARARRVAALPLACVADELEALARSLSAAQLAVRSSGPAEDGAERSFAGVFRSELFVAATGEALAAAVKSCWLGCFDAQARAYDQQVGAAFLPLIVQVMVPARVSGVLFTAHPISGDAEYVFELVEGPCALVVGGAADLMRLSCPRSELEARLAHGWGPLSADGARTLLDAAARLRRAFGDSLDIEWGITDDDVLYVHQVRPITWPRIKELAS